MTPLEFITKMDNSYNDPVGDVVAALKKTLKICSCSSEWGVLSYYFDDETGHMVLDIEKKSKK